MFAIIFPRKLNLQVKVYSKRYNLSYYYIIAFFRILKRDMKNARSIVERHYVNDALCLAVLYNALYNAAHVANVGLQQHSSSPRSHINSIKTSALSFEVINGSSSWFYGFASMHPPVF